MSVETNDNKNLKRLRAIRSGNRGVVTKYTKEAIELLSQESETNKDRLRTIANLLNEKITRLKELDAQVLELCEIDDIEQEIEETEEIFSRACDVSREIEKTTSQTDEEVKKPTSKTTKTSQVTTEIVVEKETSQTNEQQHVETPINQETDETSLNASPVHHAPPIVMSRLPKLVLPKFKGDITNYRAFWESFESAVHKNTGLTAIDKFNYLVSLLEGNAFRAIKGLAVTGDNYQAAIDILQERFGKSQQIISAHMDELLKLSPCVGEKPSQLRFVYDKVSVNVRGLEALGVKPDQYGSLLIPVIMSKLPGDVRLQIARNSVKDVWEIKELLEIIRKEVEARELSDHVTADSEKKKPPARIPSTTSSLTAQGMFGKQGGSIKCAYCGNLHFSASCETVVRPSERKEILKRDGRCFVCLQIGHRGNQCHPSKKCRRCEGKHHQSICEKFPSTSSNSGKKPNESDSKSTPERETPGTRTSGNQTVTACQNSTTATTRAKCKVFLQTATTYAYSKGQDALLPVRILMDSGSQRSYITESLKERLDLVTEKTEVLNLNTFGDDRFVKQRCDQVHLQLQGKSKDIEISALCYPKICSPLSTTLDLNRHPHLQGLDLADENLVNDSGSAPTIDILIGSDYYFEIITGEIERGGGGPVAVNSEFGWMVSGNAYSKTRQDVSTTQLIVQKAASASHACYDPMVSDEDEGLTSAVRRFWDTESLGIFEPKPLPEKEFLRDPKFDESQGRYQVSLPWKEDCVPTTNGYSSCVKRLRQVHARLKTDQDLLKEYDSVIRKQEESGIIEKVPVSSANDESTHFLPHHGVIRQDKVTTKVRVVFDGSAKHGTSTLSLNECLEKGPNLVPHLFDVVIKFRGYPVGIIADVEKAFHQIEISPDDRRMLRFLWFDDIEKEQPDIVEYQFCRLVFGLTPSPAILTSVIQRHLESHEKKEPEIVSLLQDSFYVDDFVGGAMGDNQALEICEKASMIMNDGGFALRKWNSNSKVLRMKVASVQERTEDNENVSTAVEPLGSKQDLIIDDELPAKETGTETVHSKENDNRNLTESNKDCFVKILGINWNVETDEFKYDLSELKSYATTLLPTKRSVLRLTAKVFDPMGLLTPFTINMKILFQTLCVKGVNWDDMLDGEALATWNLFIHDLSALSDIRVPRCYFRNTNEKPTSYQLHGFSDASSKAYAAVVYLRTVRSNGEVEVNLVASKTRVAPIKKQSIPRLELLGANILARLVDSVLKALASLTTTPDVVLWTDSYTVLCWIRNEKAWKPYVNRRVQEIRKLTKRESWRFCPGEQNPADLPSRGSRGVELKENTTWWYGPGFLRCSDELWPNEPESTKSDEVKAFAEITKPKAQPAITRSLTNVASNKTPNIETIMDCRRYSTKLRLVRITALVKRFIDKARRRRVPTSVELTAEEIKSAEKLWTNAIQSSSFEEERFYLLGVTKREPPLVKQLDLFLDEEGTIRCQGRIDRSTLPVTAKQPILLPTRHHYTELIIRSYHEVVHHNGVKETLNCIREVYWIPRGREAVKRVVRKCILCKKHEGKPYAAPKIAELPPSRVSDDPPFANTGIDFAGPLYLTTNAEDGKERTLEKAYVCLYTCASTRALHLELVPNLSVPTFLQSFRRFTARRGLPTKLLSDNAKTFKCAAKEVKSISRSTEVQRYFANKGITWDFIVEKAPWQGGFWERMVKCVKRCLKKAVGRASLCFEEMRTLLIEIEATLNNRPMTYVYDDEEGISYPLTPATLIYGRNIATTPNDKQFEVISTNQSLTRRLKYHRRLLNHFNNQWKKEYLTSLRESSKLTSASGKKAIEVGEVVILKNDKSSRAFWNIAKVEELLPSKDNVIRAARVRVVNQGSGKSTSLKRPIQHLIPLELRSSYRRCNDECEKSAEKPKEDSSSKETKTSRPRRNAAVIGELLRSERS